MAAITRWSDRRRQRQSKQSLIRGIRSSAHISTYMRPNVSPSVQSEFRYYLERSGRQYFNFSQCVWLDSSIRMEFTPARTTALETLAVNILTLVIRERDCRAAIGTTSRRALFLMDEFCADCLLGAPVDAWELPRTSIKAWLGSHRGIGNASNGVFRGRKASHKRNSRDYSTR
jgi:hypothetical protein